MKKIRRELIKTKISDNETSHLDSEEISFKIKSLLVSNNETNKLNNDDFHNEIKQKKLEYALEKPVSKNYLEFIIYVGDVLNKRYDLKDSSYLDKWKEAYLLYTQNKTIKQLDSILQLENILVDSIKYFKIYKISTANGKVILNNSIKQISNDISKMINKIGSENILNDIFNNQLKRNEYRRFNLAKKVSMTGRTELALPFNYLINLSIKNLDLKKNDNKTFEVKDLNMLYHTAKKYLALFQLQDFYVYSHMTLSNFSLENLHRQLTYDNIFRFNQISDDNILKIIKNLFTNLDYNDMKSKLGFDLEEYLSVIKKIISFSPTSGPKYMHLNLFTQDEVEILDLISHTEKMHLKYILPTNIQALSFLNKPLIKYDKHYLLLDLNYCAWSFYEVLLELLAAKRVNTTRREAKRIHTNIGFNIEDFLIEEFRSKNQCVHYGKYTNENECDIVIEDAVKNTLVFIEVKKKNFTIESKNGDLNFVALDFVESFIYAMNQIYRHEYYLEKNGKISFIDGSQTKIVYNNQKIERLVVTLYDFQSLTQNSLSLIEWFNRLELNFDSSFTPSSYIEKKIFKSFKKAQKQLDNLRDNLKLEEDYRKKRMNTKLVLMEYILFLLEHVNQEKFFHDTLTSNKRIVSGTADLYAEFLSYKKLKEKGKKEC